MDNAHPYFDLVANPGFQLAKTFNLLKAGMRRTLMARGHDITPEQCGMLMLVCREPGLTQSDLAERTSKDKPTVTRLLDRLEKKKLLARRQNARDRRSFTIHPTALGNRLYPDLEEALRAYTEAVFGALPQTEIETLGEILARIRSAVPGPDGAQ